MGGQRGCGAKSGLPVVLQLALHTASREESALVLLEATIQGCESTQGHVAEHMLPNLHCTHTFRLNELKRKRFGKLFRKILSNWTSKRPTAKFK